MLVRFWGAACCIRARAPSHTCKGTADSIHGPHAFKTKHRIAQYLQGAPEICSSNRVKHALIPHLLQDISPWVHPEGGKGPCQVAPVLGIQPQTPHLLWVRHEGAHACVSSAGTPLRVVYAYLCTCVYAGWEGEDRGWRIWHSLFGGTQVSHSSFPHTDFVCRYLMAKYV